MGGKQQRLDRDGRSVRQLELELELAGLPTWRGQGSPAGRRRIATRRRRDWATTITTSHSSVWAFKRRRPARHDGKHNNRVQTWRRLQANLWREVVGVDASAAVPKLAVLVGLFLYLCAHDFIYYQQCNSYESSKSYWEWR